MVQFILLGVKGIGQASVYAGICFVASVVGGRRDRARRQEVRARLADRVPGHRRHGAQHGDRHLLRRAGWLDAVHQRSVHWIQAALLTSSPGHVVGAFWLGLWAF